MMRMMRKMFKRIVSIVMALLVILGTAVYGGSASAEGAQEQADSASVTFSNDYIYLDPTGMNLNQNADWNNDNADVCIRFTKAPGGAPKKGELKNGIWEFQVSDLGYGDSNFYFTYIGGTENDNWGWGDINNTGNPYYRTGESTITVNKAKGSVVVQNGTTKMGGLDVYTIAVKKSYAGNTLSFVDMTDTLTGIRAQFSLDGNYDDSASEQVTTRQTLPLSDGKVTVPSDVDGKAYQYVRFIDDQNKAVTDFFDLAKAISKGGILYYGIRQDSSKIYSEWSQEKKSETAPDVTKLYFNNLSFKTSDEITIQIGSGEQAKVGTDETATNTLSYSISGNNIDKDTIISITKNGVTYRFYPNGTDNLITYSGSNICIKGKYQADLPNTNTVYFDATLSKLSYAGDVTDNSLPLKNSNIYFHAWNDTSDFYNGVLTKLDDFSDGTHTWSDVYKADLDKKYSHILFYSSTDGKIPDNKNANKTYDLTIPNDLKKPCFYADTSDDSIYKVTNRSGYWGELYTVRNAEGKTKDGDGAKTDTAIVDIPSGNLTRNSDMLYVNTTLYDYYSDYELNGYNRDGYSYHDNLKNLGNNPNLHYIYQPFRQFDQALSSYYDDNSASSPIYWGNFQNYNGSHYSEISDSLKLYGSDNWNKFIYENNSMWGRNAVALSNANSAVQGLVADTLSNNNLMIKASGKTVAAPYFNEDFLAGNNSKNTVLGKVYNDVTFPFVKKKVTSNSYEGSVDYWCFNSADANASNKDLQLQQSEEDGYFLNPSGQDVKGQTVNEGYPQTSDNNYFPFNTSDQSGNATKLNYGFGQKFDLKFKLTSDGTVTTDKNENVPIEFNFSGDDDVWVFIDGKLVLDVGGGHGKVTGTINFKDKKATVSSVKNDDATNGGATQNEKGFENVKEITDGYFTKEHTLTMFYMERGLWESNMSISFNFPDENQFQVEKSVDTTDVAEDFKSCFDNVSAFPFTILNQATHYAAKAATGGQEVNKTFNETFKDNTIANVDKNKFEYLGTCKDGSGNGAAKNDVVHWKAEQLDDGTYKHLRWGIIYPSTGKGKSFDATYTIGKSTTNHYKYLQFSLYDGVVTETPSLNNMYVELEDSSSNKIGGFLSAGNTYNSVNLKKGKWNTITIDLDNLSKIAGSFDYSKIANIKFDYNLSRDMYLDDFTFIPSTEVTQPTGFVTKQYEIPDYGSVKSGTLMYPLNAEYTVSSGTSSTTNLLGADGTFTLANGETATFADQFRQGSYIALSEDVDTEAFEPSWTLYENGEAVKSTVPANSKTVTQAETVELPTQAGQTIRDGRKENYVNGKDSDDKEQSNDGYTETGWAKKNGTKSYDDDRDEKNTIVFRSFTEPDNSTIVTKLKVKYTNKVKTGTIRIAKAAAYDKDKDKVTGINGNQYQFTVEFSNIAGMALETTKITKTYTGICGGEPIEISGIPAGTVYRITEIKPTDGSTLAGIDIQCPKYTGDDAKYIPTLTEDKSAVVGIVKADSDISADQPQTLFTFKNTKKPLMDLKVIKVWDKQNKDPELPQSIKVKLQRHNESDSTNHWEDVTFSTDNNSSYTEIKPNPYNNEWTYTFKNLECYVDYTIQSPVKWQYRVVELNQAGDTVLSKDDYFNNYFKLSSYSDAVSYDADKTDENKFTITNVYSPKTNIKITKVDASDEKVKLNDVEFKLEKLTAASGTDSNFVVDNKFDPIIVTTSGAEDAAGIAEFKDLPDGIYRLTETKAKEGYSLLKDPITIKIDRTGTTLVDNKNYTFGTDEDTKNTISLKISNRMKFLLPKTGGYGAMLFILCGMALATLCCLIFFLINLRKEVQYSRLKRQRKNAIGK